MTPLATSRPSARVPQSETSPQLRRIAREEALDRAAVAAAPRAAIERMSRGELIRLIRAAELPHRLCSGDRANLTYLDLPTLRRLAYLARLCCQNQTAGDAALM